MPPGRIDVAHPSVATWARERGIKPRALRSREAITVGAPTDDDESAPAAASAPTARRPKAPKPTSEPKDDRPATDEDALGEPLTAANIESHLDKPLRELTARYGNLSAFAAEVDVVKKVEETRRTYLSNEESEGELITRELVRGHVFAWLDGLSRKLLRDSSKTMVRRVYAMAISGASIESAEQVVRENMGAQIQLAKAQIVKALRGGGN